MKMFPECFYLKLTMITSSLLGIIPWQYIFVEHTFLQKMYRFYSNFMLCYYSTFLLASLMNLYQILTAADGIKLDGMALNMPVTLATSVTFSKVLIIKFSRRFGYMLNRIIETERSVIATNDKVTYEIYEKSTQVMISKSKLYLALMLACAFQYNLGPVLFGSIEQQVGNDTILIKRLPMALWFPVDEQKYYLIAYLHQILNSTMGLSYLTYTDILLFSLIAFPIGQLDILNYMLEHFDTYKQKFSNSHQIADAEVAAFSVFVENIRKHQEIIEYVEHFNAAMSALMVLEFLHFSLENALICLRAVTIISPVIVFLVGLQMVTLFVRLFLYYYYANEVIVRSNNLSNSICTSNWYDQPPRIKVLMQIMMLRSQKQLSYTIGPFTEMSLNSMIAVIRATYSYAMLIYNTNG